MHSIAFVSTCKRRLGAVKAESAKGGLSTREAKMKILCFAHAPNTRVTCEKLLLVSCLVENSTIILVDVYI